MKGGYSLSWKVLLITTLLILSPALRASDFHPEGDQNEEPLPYQQPLFEGEADEEIQLTGADICALTGYFVIPHPCNCQLFYSWYQGVFVENVCDPGLFFDSITLTCVLPEQVTCADGFGPPPPIEGGQDDMGGM